MGEQVDGEPVEAAPENGRRSLLTKGAVAAVVAAVGGVAVSRSASAANGDTMRVGTSHTGTSTTVLGGGSAFRVNNATSENEAGIGRPSLYGRTTSTDGIGVLGVAVGTFATHGVYGRATGTAAIGVFGEALATGGDGVRGRAASSGAGVYGQNEGTSAGPGVVGESTNGAGVVGIGGTFDFVATGTGRVLLDSTGPSSPPSGGALGTIARDDAGNLWFAYAANKWLKLGGPATAGAFHSVNPFRAYDSRLAAYSPNGLMGPNTNRVVSVKDAHNAAGVVTVPDSVPAGATAVAINVTVAGPTGPNFLSVTPGDAASFTASTLNWAGGYDIANGAIIKLDASRQLKLFCGDQSGSAHVIVDVTGYYL